MQNMVDVECNINQYVSISVKLPELFSASQKGPSTEADSLNVETSCFSPQCPRMDKPNTKQDISVFLQVFAGRFGFPTRFTGAGEQIQMGVICSLGQKTKQFGDTEQRNAN